MRILGQVTTTAVTRVPVNATTYVEQTSGAQRSLKSSSAADAAAGTGARKVRIVYYTLSSAGKVQGPFTEVVTLDGTNAVPTIATNIALVERLEAAEVGSGGAAAGTISMYDDAAGIGSVFCSIAAAAVRTFLGHHYVASGAQCRVTDLEFSGGDSAGAGFELVAKNYVSGVELPFQNALSDPNTGARQVLLPPPSGLVVGPARVRAMVTPANTNSQVSVASFGVVDEVVVFGA